MPRLEPGTHQSLAADPEAAFGRSKTLKKNSSEMKGKLRANEGRMKGVSLQLSRSEVTKRHKVQKVKDAVRMCCWRVICGTIPIDIDPPDSLVHLTS